MPLSEHEQRLLEQIERALLAEDPKFASSVRAADPRRHVRRRLVLAGIVFLLGAAVMVAGVVGAGPVELLGVPVLGVAGFLIMFAAVLYGVASYRRGTTAEPLRSVGGTGPGRATGRTPGRRSSLIDRLEDRWHRRADDGR